MTGWVARLDANTVNEAAIYLSPAEATTLQGRFSSRHVHYNAVTLTDVPFWAMVDPIWSHDLLPGA